MTWVKTEAPIVPSLEKYPPNEAKRFTDISITHLLIHRQGWIKNKMDDLCINSPKKAIEFGIREVGYPFYMGKPDDQHKWNAYHGQDCYTITEDYWDETYEVMMEVVLCKRLKCTPLADCEGSSIFITGMLRILNTPAYEVFGMVYRDSQPLGGHGWLVAQLEDKKFHLIESTLDNPPAYPSGYPIINPDENRWRVGHIVYEGWLKFDEQEYYEWKASEEMGLKNYVRLGRRDKERREKYVEIQTAWGIPVKPLKKRKKSLLSRLRWR